MLVFLWYHCFLGQIRTSNWWNTNKTRNQRGC